MADLLLLLRSTDHKEEVAHAAYLHPSPIPVRRSRAQTNPFLERGPTQHDAHLPPFPSIGPLYTSRNPKRRKKLPLKPSSLFPSQGKLHRPDLSIRLRGPFPLGDLVRQFHITGLRSLKNPDLDYRETPNSTLILFLILFFKYFPRLQCTLSKKESTFKEIGVM
ncbi:hypothetical protein VUR80DRAFT_1129 [Thermomyces stellatus]